MMINNSFRGNYAVVEVVGVTILIVIAVVSTVIIRPYLSPDLESIEKDIELIGYVTLEGKAVIEHKGGVSISNYEILINHLNGSKISSTSYDDSWEIGYCRYPLEDIGHPLLLNESDKVEIYILTSSEDGNLYQIFNGIFSGAPDPLPSNCPILISSLRDDTTDEDLICYSYPVVPNINATTYIYNWKLNGLPILDLNMPFDTENNVSCKDYSGNENNGSLIGVTWEPEGVVGGCLHFGGSSDYITMNLPEIFYDIENHDFTISLWVKSDDITADNAIVLMASEDNNNFVKVFLQGNEVHAGICVDGIKDAVRTENLTSSNWYHLLIVWDASEDLIIIYCNGELCTAPGYREFALGAGVGKFEIGHGTASSKFWDGYMDELEVYKKALTQDQSYQTYLSTKDGYYDKRVMVSEETSIGEIWQCVVTPNDGVQDDIPVQSNLLQIVKYPGGD